jgi:hypothetical protein
MAATAQIALAGLLHQRAVRGQNLDLPGYLEGTVGQGGDGDIAH